jgi:hypothetical protein
VTPQWRQLAARDVLGDLLAYSPPLSWTIDPTPDGPPELVGTSPLCGGTDAEHRALIVAWSQILESPVEEVQYPSFTGLYVRTSLGGVDIEIATHVGLTVPALDGAL